MRAVSTPPRNPALAPLTIALAIACGLALAQWAPARGRAPALEWLHSPRAVASVQLASAQGNFGADALRGHWQWLVLGFTHCPDLCPATLSQLAALQRALPGRRLRTVFVSVDPARDTPQRLAEYVSYFGKDFTGVTGSDDELRSLAHSLGMDFRREGSAAAPVISHSPTIALIGPDGAMRGRLRPGFDTRQVARELAERIAADT